MTLKDATKERKIMDVTIDVVHTKGLRNGSIINADSWLLLLSLFFTLNSIIYPDKLMLSKQKLSTK
jgi:hypothetical protein